MSAGGPVRSAKPGLLINGVFQLALFSITVSGCAVAPDRVVGGDKSSIEWQISALLRRSRAALNDGRREQTDRAEALLDLAASLKSHDARVVDGLGCVAWRRGLIMEARRRFQEAIDLDPAFDAAYMHLALAEQVLGNLNQTRELLAAGARLNPLNYQLLNNYAAFLIDTGSGNSALKNEAYQSLLKASEIAGSGERQISENLKLVAPAD